MSIAKMLTVALASTALMVSPALAASQATAKLAATSVNTRAGATSDADEGLFRGRGRDTSVIVFFAAILLAIGIYIAVDEEGDEPVSP